MNLYIIIIVTQWDGFRKVVAYSMDDLTLSRFCNLDHSCTLIYQNLIRPIQHFNHKIY